MTIEWRRTRLAIVTATDNHQHGRLPVLTLGQPTATLVALGLQRIAVRPVGPRRPLLEGQRVALRSAARAPVPATVGPWRIWNESGHVWWLDGRDGDPGSSDYHWLPLGFVVATATLVGAYPLVLFRTADGTKVAEGAEDQRPYGDFTPGFWAWMFADIEPVDPPERHGGPMPSIWEPTNV